MQNGHKKLQSRVIEPLYTHYFNRNTFPARIIKKERVIQNFCTRTKLLITCRPKCLTISQAPLSNSVPTSENVQLRSFNAPTKPGSHIKQLRLHSNLSQKRMGGGEGNRALQHTTASTIYLNIQLVSKAAAEFVPTAGSQSRLPSTILKTRQQPAIRR